MEKAFLIGRMEIECMLSQYFLTCIIMSTNITPFEDYNIRRLYDEEKDIWYFSVTDIIQALTQQKNFQAARNYWKVLKNRLKKEGSQVVTDCNRLKLRAA